jgi:hypothetical protein
MIKLPFGGDFSAQAKACRRRWLVFLLAPVNTFLTAELYPLLVVGT